MNRLVLLFGALLATQLIGAHDYSWYVVNGKPGGEWPLVWEDDKDNVAIVELLLINNSDIWSVRDFGAYSKFSKSIHNYSLQDKIVALRELAKKAPPSTLDIWIQRYDDISPTVVQISALATYRDLIAKIGMVPGDKLFYQNPFSHFVGGLSVLPLDEAEYNELDRKISITDFKLISSKDVPVMIGEIEALSADIISIIKADVQLDGLYAAMQWLDFMKHQKMSIDKIMYDRLHSEVAPGTAA